MAKNDSLKQKIAITSGEKNEDISIKNRMTK